MKKIKMYYVDARDGRPADVAPPRHGAVHPVEAEVDYIDRRAVPAVIYGRVEDKVKTDVPGVQVLTDQEYQSALDGFKAREKDRAMSMIRSQRRRIADGGTLFDFEVETSLETRTDRTTRDDVRDVKEQMAEEEISEVPWEYKPHAWATLDQEKADKLLKTIRKHRADAFSRQRQLEEDLEQAASLSEVAAVKKDVRKDWPETLEDA